MRSAIRFALPLAAVLAALLAPAPTLASGIPPNVVADPHKGFEGIELRGIAAISPTDVWDVGMLVQGRHRPTLTAIEHWDGTAWTTYPSPNPGAAGNALYKVEALSSDDVWALGTYQDLQQGQIHPLVLHWDGASWSQSPFRDVGVRGSNVIGLSALSPTDVWAVGQRLGGVSGKTLTEHWDGQRWQVVRSRNVSGAYLTSLVDVTAISENDVWAVGVSLASGRSEQEPLAEHWNGSRWRIVPTADPDDSGGGFGTVYAAAHDDVWAAGISGQVPQHVVIQHWDGMKWSAVDAPTPGNHSSIGDLDGSSAMDIWAVGDEAGRHHPLLIEHWDGTAWSDASLPGEPDGRNGLLLSVSTDAADDAWAVGWEEVPNPLGGWLRVTIRIHWDGTSWSPQ